MPVTSCDNRANVISSGKRLVHELYLASGLSLRTQMHRLPDAPVLLDHE